MPAPSHPPQVTHPHSTGGRTGRESRGDELRRSSRQAGWTAPRSLSRGWPRGKMLPRDSPDPRQGDHSGKTSLPSPHQITTVVTASLYKDFKTRAPGAPQLPPPRSSTCKSARLPTTRGWEHILSPFTKKKTCKTVIYASFQPSPAILLGAAQNKGNSTLPHTRKKKRNI